MLQAAFREDTHTHAQRTAGHKECRSDCIPEDAYIHTHVHGDSAQDV